MTFNQLIKSKGFSQHSLCLELKRRYKCFKYQQQISDWASNIRFPDIETTYYLSKLLDVSCDTLIGIFIKGKYEKSVNL